MFSETEDRLVGLVVKKSASRAKDPGFESRLRRDFFRGRVIPVTSKLALQWLPCQAPGGIGSELGLVGPVSVNGDWVRWKVGSASFISVRQHLNCLSRSVPRIHKHVAGTLNNQPINKHQRLKEGCWTPRYTPHWPHGPGAGIMEDDDRRVTTVFTVQPSFHHRHSTNRISRSATIVGETTR